MAHLSGWTYRRALSIPSSAWSLSGDVTDFTLDIVITSALAEFWALAKSDGGDVRFTASDGTTLLKKGTIKFDSTGDEAVYKVKIPTLAAASDPTIYLYCGNASATTDDDFPNVFSSAVRECFPLDQNYSGGGFIGLKAGLSGTNNGTTDAADQLTGARGRTVTCTVPNDIQINDNNLLSFGDGATDADMSIVANVKMTDATRFRICSKGSAAPLADGEYHFVSTGVDTLIFYAFDKSSAGYVNRVSTGTLTADEGSWVRLIATKTGTTINLYRNATVMAMGSHSISSYTAMENTTGPLNIGSYYHTADITGSGVIGELMLLAEVVSADWMKCYEYACSGSWISWGAQEFFIDDTGTGTDAVSVDVGASTISITDTGTGTDSIASLTASLTITDTGNGLDAILAYNGQLVSVTETGGGIDTLGTILAALGIADTASGADGINVSGGSSSTIILESTPLWPQGQTAQYQIVDEFQAVVQSWTSAGVFEVQTMNKSVYSVKISPLSQYTILWKIAGTRYEASRTVDLFESNNDIATSTRLAAADFIAPDNAGIAALLADTALLIAFIKNKKYLEKTGATWYLVIRNADDSGDILRKAIKGTDGTTEITDIAAAAMGMEIKSSV